MQSRFLSPNGLHGPLSRTLPELRFGHHVCWIYDDVDEQREMVAWFIRDGLSRNQRCVYIVHDRTMDEICASLRESGVDVAEQLRAGALELTTAEQTYLQGGRFDPESMIDRLGGLVAESRETGYDGLRIAGEMGWIVSGARGTERWCEYEAMVNRFLVGQPCVAMCQYHRPRVGPRVTRGAICTHPFVVHGDWVCRNDYYVPPAELLDAPSAADEVQRWLTALTQREMAEWVLREREDTFEVLFREAPLAYQSLDANGCLLEISRAWCEQLRYSRRDVLGRWFGDLLSPASRVRFQENFPRLKDVGRAHGVEYELLRGDGSHMWVSFDCGLSYGKNGEFQRTHCIFRDITVQKLAQVSSRTNEQRFRTLFNGVGDALLIYPAYGRFVEVNDEACRRYGYSRDELLRMGPQDIDSPEQAAHVPERMRQVVTDGHVCFETMHRCRDGMTIPTEVHAQRITVDGQELFLSVCRDVTERKRFEDELARYRDGLEELVAAKTAQLEASKAMLVRSEKLASLGTFAAGIAHEINNPLGAMMLTAEAALLQPESLDRSQRALREVVAHTQRAKAVIKNVLQFAREEASKRTRCDLAEVLRFAVSMVWQRSARQGCDVAADLPESGPILDASESALAQVFVNLLQNAVDAGADRVEVTVEVTADETVVVRVADDGPGIPADVQPRLFDPFFTTKQAQGGTGLGLSITHRIVEEHGGSIDVDSVEGRGATFTVTLPLVCE